MSSGTQAILPGCIMMINQGIPGVERYSIKGHSDKRGLWQRVWEADNPVIRNSFESSAKQVSVSYNPELGTLRGLHSLKPSAGETKFVFCVQGKVQDVALDIRRESVTFGTHASFILEQGMGVKIPPGVAHGFLTLEPDSTLVYVMTAFYNPELEVPIRWNDPRFNINWVRTPEVISSKDKNIPDYE